MKREGRQHGMVRTTRILPSPWNPRPDSRFVNKFDSPPTAGLFTKVSPKPTNHSKFTGKCGRARCNGCHIHPACKSKDKTKGTQKLRSCDMVTNHRLITWRVVDGRPGLNFSGFSATGMLDHLSSDHVDDEVDDYADDFYDHDGPYGLDDDGLVANFRSLEGEEIKKDVHIEDYVDDDKCDDDDNMSFCDVGFVLDQVEGDEGWCLVGEM